MPTDNQVAILVDIATTHRIGMQPERLPDDLNTADYVEADEASELLPPDVRAR